LLGDALAAVFNVCDELFALFWIACRYRSSPAARCWQHDLELTMVCVSVKAEMPDSCDRAQWQIS